MGETLELKAVFTEHAHGFFTLRTEGIYRLVLEGPDFKDLMLELVRAVNQLKKTKLLPTAFELRSHLKVYFE
jgi:hypothetical protein